MAVLSLPVHVSALKSPCPIIQAVAVDVGKNRWQIALAIKSDVWTQQTSDSRHFQVGKERKHPGDKPLVHHEQSSSDLLRAASPEKSAILWNSNHSRHRNSSCCKLLCKVMQGCVYAFSLACGRTIYVKTFDSAPHHADRVERNGMQAWRSCNGETRDEMRWRVGKDGKVSGRNHTCMSRMQPPTQMSNVLEDFTSLPRASLAHMDI